MKILRYILAATLNNKISFKEKEFMEENWCDISLTEFDFKTKDIESPGSGKFAVFFDPVRVYNSNSIEEIFLKDGTQVLITYDYIKNNWGIFNIDTGEKVYPLKSFDMNNEMINHEFYISVTFRGSVLVADTWDKIKEYSR